MQKTIKNLSGLKIYKDLTGPLMDYIGSCTARGVASPKTKAAYFAGIEKYLMWCAKAAVDPRLASRMDVERWRRVMVDLNLSPRTIMVRLAAVRTLYKALMRAGIRADNPSADVKPPKIKTPAIEVVMANLVFPEQMIVVLAKLADDSRGRRDRVVLLILYLLGLRLAEAAGLSWRDYKDDLLAFLSKGGQERKLAVPAALKAALEELKVDASAEPIFLNAGGGRLSIRGIQKMITARLKAAGIHGRSPHSLRHSCATAAAMAGVSPYAIQDQLGHASQRTTSIYTRAAGRLMDAPSGAVARALGI